MTPSRSFFWSTASLVVLFCLVVSSALYLTERFRSDTMAAFMKFQAKPELTFYNSEYELLRLQIAVEQYAAGMNTEENVFFRQEIFASRAIALDETQFFQVHLRRVGSIAAANDASLVLMAQIDAILADGLQQADIQIILDAIESVKPMMRTAINDIANAENATNRDLFTQVEAGQLQIQYALTVSVVAFLLLTAIFVYQMTHTRRNNRNIKQLYEIAEGAVKQLRTELQLRTQAEQANQELRIAVERSKEFILIADEEGKILLSNASTAIDGHMQDVQSISLENAIRNRLELGATLSVPDPTSHATDTFGYILPGRRRLWLEWSVTEFITNDGSKRYLAIARDVTQERQANEQVARIQKVETLGIMAGGMAHDFNNVLSTIVGSAHLALDDAKDNQQGEIAEELEQIITAAGRASELIEGLMKLGRNDANDRDVTQWGAVSAQVEKLINAVHAHNIDVHFDGANRNVWVEMSSSNLHQIVYNLIKNAMDAIGQSSGSVSIALSLQDDWAEISIADTGPGIPKDVQARIFEPFFSTKASGKGSGLGLSIVKSLIMGSNGEIDLDSSLGKGTTFKIRLPVHKVEVTEAPRDILPNIQETPKKDAFHVLIVDDEADVLRVTKRLIEKAGYDVVAHSDPFDANEYFVDNYQNIDAIVSDVIMPGMTGPTMVEEMRAHDPDIGVIFVSAYTDVDIGLNDNTLFLQKPANPAKLFQSIETLCNIRAKSRTN